MNKGIRNYCKFISQSIGSAGDVFLNVNKSDANMHVNIPLYQSNGYNPINLNLMLTLSELEEKKDFGMGTQINFFKRFFYTIPNEEEEQGEQEEEEDEEDEFVIYAHNWDGSYDYYYEGDGYFNKETMTQISRFVLN